MQSAEKVEEDQNRRAALQEANQRLSDAKKRIAAKRELLEARERKLREFQRELTPSLKLGSGSFVR